MGLFDNLETKAAEIASKTGLAVTVVHAIANTFQANLTSSDGNPEEAIEAANRATRRGPCDRARNRHPGRRLGERNRRYRRALRQAGRNIAKPSRSSLSVELRSNGE